MAIDMFLFLYAEGSQRPIVLDVLAWSWGASSSDCRGRRRRRNAAAVPPADSQKPAKRQRPADDAEEFEVKGLTPSEWSCSDVSRWLEYVGLGALAPALAAARVDGEVLLALGGAELKEAGVAQLGARKKLLARVAELSARGLDEQPPREAADEALDVRTDCNDLSATCYMGAQLYRGCLLPLLTGARLDRAAVVCYTSAREQRYGGGRDDDDDGSVPRGTPYMALELHGSRVTSVSTGGSGGEDRLTANVTLSFERLRTHLLALQDCRKDVDLLASCLDVPDDQLELFKAAVRLAAQKKKKPQGEQHGDSAEAGDGDGDDVAEQGAPSPSLLDIAPGMTVDHKKGCKAKFVQWGGALNWSTATHRIFPDEFRQAVRTTLLAQKRGESPVSMLNPTVLQNVFAVLSTSYTANPLAQWPYPNPSAIAHDEHH
eukprot:m51a1_g9115 hypothetical protein (431) ;mRNA; f:124707-126247